MLNIVAMISNAQISKLIRAVTMQQQSKFQALVKMHMPSNNKKGQHPIDQILKFTPSVRFQSLPFYRNRTRAEDKKKMGLLRQVIIHNLSGRARESQKQRETERESTQTQRARCTASQPHIQTRALTYAHTPWMLFCADVTGSQTPCRERSNRGP